MRTFLFINGILTVWLGIGILFIFVNVGCVLILTGIVLTLPYSTKNLNHMKNKIIYYFPVIPIIGIIFVFLVTKKLIPMPEHSIIETFFTGDGDDLTPSKKAYAYAWFQAVCVILPIGAFFIYELLTH